MSRTKEELTKTLVDVKGKYKLEFGRDFPTKRIKDIVSAVLQTRHENFVHRYLDHLPKEDLNNFEQLLEEDLQAPTFTANKQPVKKEEVKIIPKKEIIVPPHSLHR
jgi:hypothetical protein